MKQLLIDKLRVSEAERAAAQLMAPPGAEPPAPGKEGA